MLTHWNLYYNAAVQVTENASAELCAKIINLKMDHNNQQVDELKRSLDSLRTEIKDISKDRVYNC